MNNHTDIILPIRKDSHFIKMPFIALDELDPFHLSVLSLYIRLSWGSSKPIDLGGREGSRICQMSRPKFGETRRSLHEKGYIILTESPDPEQPAIVEVCVDKIWARNAEKYQSAEEISHDLAAHITSGKLDEGSLLGLKELIEQMLGVESIDSGGGVNMPQGGVKRLQGWTKSLPHLVDIEFIDIDSSIDGAAADEPPVEKAVSSGLRDDATLNSNARVRQVPVVQPVEKNIEDHPLTMALVEFAGKRLNTRHLDKLKAKISYEDQDGGKYTFPSLITCYETYTGFDKFVEARLEQAGNMEQKLSLDIVIGNLKNFHKLDGWYGWLKWKELHPEFTTDRAALPDPDAPVKVVYRDTSAEAGSRWLDNLGDDVPMETE